ncbi:uncharacterized protein LOC122650590 [Telopea speciosissima]|uniref:uncharacterized protein LOC122650590 n=1 Tax=Telopea speciosissima TaxID=54955 RepID=UPI001CC3A8E9|nr:uncharacterized protein LOC122650590 [Telopea speciosissima]
MQQGDEGLDAEEQGDDVHDEETHGVEQGHIEGIHGEEQFVGAQDKGSKRPVKKKRDLRRRGSSKSLSALEFEELKEFMDLSFVFSKEDKDSSLVSIIPGLQRLGKKSDEKETTIDESAIPRPYLSEAWDLHNRRTEENPLMNWRFPASGSEIDIKYHLKIWAHIVASTLG